MREKYLSISRRIFCRDRIVWYVVIVCLMSYSPAGAQSSTRPVTDNNIGPTVSILTGTVVVVTFSLLVVQCCCLYRTAVGQSQLSGVEPAVVEAFPVLVYSALKQIGVGEASLECAVCLSEFADDDKLRLLPKCNHAFHPACIDKWLASHVTCPVCRANITPESADISKDSAHQATTVPNQQNSTAQCNETRDEIVITIHEEQNRDSEAAVMSSASQQTNLPRRGAGWDWAVRRMGIFIDPTVCFQRTSP